MSVEPERTGGPDVADADAGDEDNVEGIMIPGNNNMTRSVDTGKGIEERGRRRVGCGGVTGVASRMALSDRPGLHECAILSKISDGRDNV